MGNAGNNFPVFGVSNSVASRYRWRKTPSARTTITTFFMLRTALLFFCMLGFLASESYAAPATAATSRPIHRRKPTAGNYVPVYRYYRGHSSQKTGFFGLFKHRSKAAKRHSSAPRVARGGRPHRTM
jgi:hypothetical protein